MPMHMFECRKSLKIFLRNHWIGKSFGYTLTNKNDKNIIICKI